MADKEPDKLAAKIPAKEKKDPEKRKRKTSHYSSTEIEAALIADDTADTATPKSTTTSSARRKLSLPTKISDGSADLFDDSLVSPISASDMPTMSESMLEGMSFIDKELEREKEREKDAEIFGDDVDLASDPDYKIPDLEPPSDEDDDVDDLYTAALDSIP